MSAGAIWARFKQHVHCWARGWHVYYTTSGSGLPAVTACATCGRTP